MSSRIGLFLLAGAVGLITIGCGGDDEDFAPVELLYFVQGPSGALFEVVQEGDNDDCMAQSRDQIGGLIPSGGYGFQTQSATHVLDGTFVAPHYFVFENERQPTRAVIRNLSQSTLTVQQLRGLAPPGTTLETRTIPPLGCRSISTFSDDEEMVGFPGIPYDLDDEYRIEVCSFGEDVDLPDGFECDDIAPRGDVTLDADGNPLRDIGAAFLATTGDLDSSYLTRCLQLENSEQLACRTPATFYLFDPQDIIGIAMTRFRDQVDSYLQVDLYRGDRRIGSNRGDGDVFIREEL